MRQPARSPNQEASIPFFPKPQGAGVIPDQAVGVIEGADGAVLLQDNQSVNAAAPYSPMRVFAHDRHVQGKLLSSRNSGRVNGEVRNTRYIVVANPDVVFAGGDHDGGRCEQSILRREVAPGLPVEAFQTPRATQPKHALRTKREDPT